MKTFIVTSILFLFFSCSQEPSKKYVKSPLDVIITKYSNVPSYSVILEDMDYKEASETYLHKYKIIVEKKNATETTEDDFEVKVTDWVNVSPITFEEHINDLGMTVLSKKDGVLDKMAKPAGYNNYVGNEKYGQWKQGSNGSSFWAFYGQYHFLSSMLGGNRRYYRGDYDNHRNNRGRGYYGKNNTYGTNSTANQNSNWNSKPKTFQDKVRGNVKRSSSAMKSKGYSSSKSYKNSPNRANSSNTSNRRTSRSSSRYNNSSSSRSRSGGYGK